jgi:hypothetical protein
LNGTENTRFSYIFGAESNQNNDNTSVPASLEAVTITGGDTIPNEAFRYCRNLTSITMPDSTKSIGDRAFINCSGLTVVTIPDSVTSIGISAFRGCSGLTGITIPNNVTSINSLTFQDCSELKSITIGTKVTSIATSNGSAFSACPALMSIEVVNDNSVYRSEGNCLIRKSDNALLIVLKNSIIPEGTTIINIGAFHSFGGVTSITIPFVGNILNGISNTCFGHIFGATSYLDQNDYYIPSSLRTVIITGGTSIGASAFYRCTGLTSVTIPASVTSIGNEAFIFCNNLEYVTFDTGSNINFNNFGDNAFPESRVTARNTLRTAYISDGGGAGTYRKLGDGWVKIN